MGKALAEWDAEVAGLNPPNQACPRATHLVLAPCKWIKASAKSSKLKKPVKATGVALIIYSALFNWIKR